MCDCVCFWWCYCFSVASPDKLAREMINLANITAKAQQLISYILLNIKLYKTKGFKDCASNLLEDHRTRHAFASLTQ